MSLLTIVQNACDLLSIPRPATVVGSTDQQVRQLFAIANEEGRSLASSYDWEALRLQHTFTTVASAEQPSAVPADWDRFIANSFFNRTTRRNIIGPITPQQWQAIQAQPQLNRVFLAFIRRRGQFLVTPTPEAGEEIAYEYVTVDWAYADGSLDPKPAFTQDTDGAFLDEWLITLGIRWRFLKSKGLDYAEDYRTYQSELVSKQARDGGNTELTTTGDTEYILSPNIPVGSFPGP